MNNNPLAIVIKNAFIKNVINQPCNDDNSAYKNTIGNILKHKRIYRFEKAINQFLENSGQTKIPPFNLKTDEKNLLTFSLQLSGYIRYAQKALKKMNSSHACDPDLIKLYDKSGNSIKNISLLPHGLKGIIYYKTHDLNNKGINVTIDISKRVTNYLGKINHNDFVILCRCVPILLDNAVDACLLSNDKNLIVSIYLEKNNIIVSVENSTDRMINIEFINEKNYSTKGENRGLGLYIVNNLLSKSKKIVLKQEYVNNYFISKLIIKK
jgi:hypothetical protein